MRKLLFVLLAFLAVFTYIRAIDSTEIDSNSPEARIETSESELFPVVFEKM
ncbi:MAG: hypothetical protein FWD47_07530 [Treponema sp.]|nr:hypothetical protein [Treponema sp.]